MLPVIKLVPQFHRGEERIFFNCHLSTEIEYCLKRLKGCKWSTSYKAWYIPLSKQGYLDAKQSLLTTAVLETTNLKQYLLKRKVTLSLKVSLGQKRISQLAPKGHQCYEISEINARELHKLSIR